MKMTLAEQVSSDGRLVTASSDLLYPQVYVHLLAEEITSFGDCVGVEVTGGTLLMTPHHPYVVSHDHHSLVLE